MESREVITSAGGLLTSPDILRAEIIELSLCDAVNFQLIEPAPVFALVEWHLRKNGDRLFSGYAAVRESVEKRLPGASLKEKVDDCCIDHPEWIARKQVLYSTELEVWMDLSYANPWALDLYHKALYLGKALTIRQTGQFTPVFIRYLLQKNGFAQLAATQRPDKTIRVVFGDNGLENPLGPVFVPDLEGQREHALACGTDLACLLANGCMLKDRRQHLALGTPAKKRHLHELGYRHIGPCITLLIQRLAERNRRAGFTGTGAEFLTTLAQTARESWLWMPEIVAEDEAVVLYSLLPDPKALCSMLPHPAMEGAPSVIPIAACYPEALFLNPLKRFFFALLAGQPAEDVRTGAAAFVRDYSAITHGLHLKLSLDPILREWRRLILSPSHEFLQAILAADIVPGFNAPHYPWQARRQVKRGPWPTGSYLLASSLDRWWLKLTLADRLKNIGDWYDRVHTSVAGEPATAH